MYRLDLLLPILLLSGAASAIAPKDGEALIREMHQRYDGKWYRTLTFVQKTSFPDGRSETWYEAAEMPGKLRIDVAPVDSMNTILFRNDSVYQYQRGERKVAEAMTHPLMVLGFDVYAPGTHGDHSRVAQPRLRPRPAARGHLAGAQGVGGGLDGDGHARPGVLGRSGASAVRAAGTTGAAQRTDAGQARRRRDPLQSLSAAGSGLDRHRGGVLQQWREGADGGVSRHRGGSGAANVTVRAWSWRAPGWVR